eukprot:TRINITY_DN3062_c0_g1_i1.p1 TRINITY_DN3062_c0_g1~~TRINITY_DN3062_c0_g1_i1.p1  ORF type:complete len:831 (+),score=279.54 TRINITY_DN3062_c0_g1_i1:1252-3744(+)
MLDIEELYTPEPYKILTDGQLKNEIQKCLGCDNKGCQRGCPVGCSPADFIHAVRQQRPQDFIRAAKLILNKNPMGGLCGAVCPDTFCQAKCNRRNIDDPIQIPQIQATIVAKAREFGLDSQTCFVSTPITDKRVAVIGGGPAGIAAGVAIAQHGIQTVLFEKHEELGGAVRYIPEHRLPKDLLDKDIACLVSHPLLEVKTGVEIQDPTLLLEEFSAVVVTVGLNKDKTSDVPGAIESLKFLSQEFNNMSGKSITIIGGGAVAVDCASKARRLVGPKGLVSIAYRRSQLDMPLTKHERQDMMIHGIDIITRVLPVGYEEGELMLQRVLYPPRGVKGDVVFTNATMAVHSDLVVSAIGHASNLKVSSNADNLYFAGDYVSGASTAVQAVASAKKTVSHVVANLLNQKVVAHGDRANFNFFDLTPVPLNSTFFGKPMINPFMVSASPLTDGLEECRSCLNAGWGGVVMKTAFDGEHIHIPSDYMGLMDENTYSNCDNVSGHPLSRVIEEVAILKREYPDRIIMASTGGPLTGTDEHNRAGWQKNVAILQNAGVDAVELSLSCPSGGEGGEGEIASQSAALTAKIVDWVLEGSDGVSPILFKLTGAVTSIEKIASACKSAFEKHPTKPAGITLANSFPAAQFVEFNRNKKTGHYQGRTVGLHGQGVVHISYKSLANACQYGLETSGNGGVMNYFHAANFLALGVNSVQCCTLPTKEGVEVIDDLCYGLSHWLAMEGLNSVDELKGRAVEEPLTGFLDLSPVKRISEHDMSLCVECGNCKRCPYMAIDLRVIDGKYTLETDASKCIGCSICVLKCPADAMYMRDRTPEELEVCPE